MHHALSTMHRGVCRTGGIVRNRLLSPLSTQRSTSSTHRVLLAEKTSEILTTSPPSLQNMQEIKSLFHPSNSEVQSKENVEGHKCKQQHSPLSPVSPFLYGSSFVSFQRDVSPHPHPCLSSQKTAPSFTREASRVKATSNCDIQNCLCHYRQQKYKRHEQTRVGSTSKQETAFRKHVWKHIDANIDTIFICLSSQWASLIHFWSSLAKSGKRFANNLHLTQLWKEGNSEVTLFFP